MTDKRVVIGNFKGIKDGSLVHVKYGSPDLPDGVIALVINRSLNAMMLGEGECERYDEVLVLLHGGKRHYVSVNDVDIVEEDVT